MSGVFTIASLVFIESLLHELFYIMFDLNSLIGGAGIQGVPESWCTDLMKYPSIQLGIASTKQHMTKNIS